MDKSEQAGLNSCLYHSFFFFGGHGGRKHSVSFVL
jgi:hypothetical protein